MNYFMLCHIKPVWQKKGFWSIPGVLKVYIQKVRIGIIINVKRSEIIVITKLVFINMLITLYNKRRNLALAGRNWWHCSTEWNLRFIQNVASCYVLCLKESKESVITATLVHAPVCVNAHRTEVWVIRVRLKYQVEAGPDWITFRSGSGPESGLWEALVYTNKLYTKYS